MMFVLEAYIKNRQAKIRQWEQRGRAWVSEKNKESRYTAYSIQDYEKQFPRPRQKGSEFAGMVFPILGGVAVVALIIAFTVHVVSMPDPDPNNPNGCSVLVKKGDSVAVTAGDFSGSKGTIIDQKSDCSVDLTLTNSTYTLDRCHTVSNGYCSNAKENGDILNVDTDRNIIKL